MPDGSQLSPDQAPRRRTSASENSAVALGVLTQPIPHSTVRMGSSGRNVRQKARPFITEPTYLGEVAGIPLSPREREVLSLASTFLAAGNQDFTSRIADKLGISGHTVKHTLARAREKLGAITTAEAVGMSMDSDQIGHMGEKNQKLVSATTKLGSLTPPERDVYLALANANDIDGYAQLAFSLGLSEQTIKNTASSVWSKLGITRSQVKIFHRKALRQKIKRAKKMGLDPDQLDIFYGIPTPESPSPNKYLPTTEFSTPFLENSTKLKGLTPIERAKYLTLVAEQDNPSYVYLADALSNIVSESSQADVVNRQTASNELNGVFSSRQKEILYATALGKNSFAIAEDLGIARLTVNSYKDEILRKTQAATITDAVIHAINLGEIDPLVVIPRDFRIASLAKLSKAEKRDYAFLVRSGEYETYAQVAHRLGVVESSLKNRTKGLWRELGLSSRSQAIIVNHAIQIAELRFILQLEANAEGSPVKNDTQ